MSRKAKARHFPLLARGRVPHRLSTNIEEMQAVFARINRSWGPNLVATATEQMCEILTAAGLRDDPLAVVVEENGRDRVIGGHEMARFLAAQRKTRGKGIVRPFAYFNSRANLAQRLGHQVGSTVWFAARILDQVDGYRSAVKRADQDEVLHTALHLGALMMEADITVSLGRELAVGVQQYPGLVTPPPCVTNMPR